MISVKSNNNRRNADVIVIGAGSFGCHVAYQLRQRGLDVLVLEAMAAPATQATGAAAGFVANFSTVHRADWAEIEWEMQQYGIEFYTRLAESSDQDIGFCPCGIAYIYLTDQRWKDVQPRILKAREHGTRLEVLDANRAGQVLPQIHAGRTVGVIYDPQSIRIRAGDAIGLLAQRLQNDGVRFQFGVRMTSLEQVGNQIAGVNTSQGQFHGARVIVATGAWSRPIVQKLGTVFPAEPRVVARYTTRPLPGTDNQMPMIIFSDSPYVFFIREEKGGLLIGGVDPPPLPADRFVDIANPPSADQLPHDQAYRMREYVRGMEHVMPVLKDAEIDRIDAGLPNYTDDRHFIADEVPGCQGLYVIAACNEAGITHGPALGRHMAELVLDGETRWDRSRFGLERFR